MIHACLDFTTTWSSTNLLFSLLFFLATNRFDFFSGRGHRETTVVSMLLQQVVPERCLITTDSDFGGYL